MEILVLFYGIHIFDDTLSSTESGRNAKICKLLCASPRDAFAHTRLM